MSFDKTKISLDDKTELLNSIKFRGPDNTGIYNSSDDSVFLGHSRLSIIDISEKSNQPMLDSNLGMTIVFNGVIYNYVSLRNELIKKGYSFTSDGDTEVIIKAYHFYGSKCLDKIDGIVHCTGGGQTKVLHFVENLHIIKDKMFEIPPVFKLIQQESLTEWREMFKVFNMGHRMEIYIDEIYADSIIKISKSFDVEAKIIGRVEKAKSKKLTISTKFGSYIY